MSSPLRRGNRIYFRKAVPLDLRKILGKAEIKVSLGTSDIDAARPDFARLNALWEQRFQSLRRGIVKEAEVPTADEVYDLVASFIGDGRLPSADAIVARLGGSKTRVLALRDEAYARLRAEGKPTDPIAGLQSAAEPMLRKVLELATLRIEKEYASEIALLRAQIQTLNADVAQDACD